MEKRTSGTKPLKTTAIADACSSFPVGFSLLRREGWLFAAFYDPLRRITVAARRDGAEEWDFFKPEGRWLPERGRLSSITDFDSHNYLALAVDDGGHLHLSGNMHSDPLIYFRSEKPLEISSLVPIDRMTGCAEGRVTYPIFFRGPGSELLFRYRNGESGNGVDYYNVYDLQARSWSRLLDKPLLDGEGSRNAYARLPQPGPDGRWHLVWMWRESSDCSTNHTLSYARSSDLIHWERSDGTPLPIPITLAAGEVVDPSPMKGGLINMSQDLGFDSVGRPILVYHRYDADGHSQLFSARRETEGWVIRALSDWAFRWEFEGQGSIAAEIGHSGPVRGGEGRLEVVYEGRQAGSGVWVLDEATLRVLETQPPRPSLFPAELLAPTQDLAPGMEVRIAAAEGAPEGKACFLRWETLPANRDIAPGRETPPTRLELIEVG